MASSRPFSGVIRPTNKRYPPAPCPGAHPSKGETVVDGGDPAEVGPEAALPVADRDERNVRVKRQGLGALARCRSVHGALTTTGRLATPCELEAVPLDVAMYDVEIILLARDRVDDARHQLCGVFGTVGVPDGFGNDRHEPAGRLWTRPQRRRSRRDPVGGSRPRARRRHAPSRHIAGAERAGTAVPRMRCAAPDR